jgi:protein-L-isoaspartate(D-aspartate) O-methyltransferase
MAALTVRLVVVAALLLAVTGGRSAAAEAFAAERQRMAQQIAAHARETHADTGKRAFDTRVMEVMAKVPRHAFVPADQLPYAYQNRPLPIGHGQTISQPYIVALMTDMARAEPGHKVLEVGTGSGYQAAATTGGKNMRPTTPSSSPRPPVTFRRRSSASSRPAAGW